MKYLRLIWAVALIEMALLPSVASAVVFPSEDLIEVTENSLFRWNLNTSTDIYTNKQTGTSVFGDMTRMADGRYVAYRGSYSGATPALFEVNPTTGSVSLMVQSNSAAGQVVALVPMKNGNLFAFDNSLHYISINPTTLAYTPLNIAGAGFEPSAGGGGMAVSPDGDIYGWCSGFSTNSGVFAALFRIDPIAGTAQKIGSGFDHISFSANVDAMSFTPNGRLFGFTTASTGLNGEPLKANGVYEFNLQTGMPTLLTQRSELAAVRGVMFVPEPGLSLLAFGGLALLRRRKASRTLLF